MVSKELIIKGVTELKGNEMSEQFDRIMRLIEETKNDKLKYEFLNYVDKWLVCFKKDLDDHNKKSLAFDKEQDKLMLEASANRLKLNRIEQDIHDKDIEFENKYKKINKEFAERLDKKLDNITKLVFMKPRLTGWLLLIGGQKTIELVNKYKPKDHTNEAA